MLWVCRDREGFFLPVANLLLLLLLVAGDVGVYVLLILLPIIIHSQPFRMAHLLILLVL